VRLLSIAVGHVKPFALFPDEKTMAEFSRIENVVDVAKVLELAGPSNLKH